MVISPSSPFYTALLTAQAQDYEDVYFPEDAIYMERNSRDFQERVARENFNALLLCNYFRTRRADGPYAEGMVPVDSSLDSLREKEVGRKRVIKEIYYPKFMTPGNYEACMRPTNLETTTTPGYGGLFSLTFTSILASATFFDNLPCYKGPSLGTNFTLACPYTLLAHYTETVWAKEWGVEIGLVRVSTGLEESEMLLEWFRGALEAAEIACGKAEGL